MSECCPICNEFFSTENEKFQLPSCSHLFCVNCIKSWARQSVQPTCPVCRQNFSRSLVISDTIETQDIAHGRVPSHVWGPAFWHTIHNATSASAGWNALLSAGTQDVFIVDAPDSKLEKKNGRKNHVQFFYRNVRLAKHQKRNKER